MAGFQLPEDNKQNNLQSLCHGITPVAYAETGLPSVDMNRIRGGWLEMTAALKQILIELQWSY